MFAMIAELNGEHKNQNTMNTGLGLILAMYVESYQQ
jgi:hypothetical protein